MWNKDFERNFQKRPNMTLGIKWVSLRDHFLENLARTISKMLAFCRTAFLFCGFHENFFLCFILMYYVTLSLSLHSVSSNLLSTVWILGFPLVHSAIKISRSSSEMNRNLLVKVRLQYGLGWHAVRSLPRQVSHGSFIPSVIKISRSSC